MFQLFGQARFAEDVTVVKEPVYTKPVARPGTKPLEYGEELKLAMKDGSYRLVTVIHARRNGVKVREMFAGEYAIDYNDISYIETDHGTEFASWLRERGNAHVDRLTDWDDIQRRERRKRDRNAAMNLMKSMMMRKTA